MNGWTLLYKTVERDIETKSDVLIAVTHWQLLRFGMKCIGIGDDKTLHESDEESELLPDGWNMNKKSYALRYKYQNEVFIFLGSVVDDTIVLNLLNGKSLEVSNAAFVLESTVAALSALKGELNTLISGIDAVVERLKKELIEPVMSLDKKTSETQTSHTVELSDPLHPYFPFGGYVNLGERSSEPSSDILRDIRGVGRSDLDPLGARFGTGGGMLFNPPGMRNPQNPLGGMPGVIPGARFDPFNPPEVERQRRNSRDFDHFRPPGGPGGSFYDDMFM